MAPLRLLFPKDRGGVGADREADDPESMGDVTPSPLLEVLLTPPPKSLSLWAMMPGMAMSSSGDRISDDPPSTLTGLPAFPPAFDRGFISFVKERRFAAESPPPLAVTDDASEISLMGDSLSPPADAEAETGVEGEAMEAGLEDGAAGIEFQLLSSAEDVFCGDGGLTAVGGGSRFGRNFTSTISLADRTVTVSSLMLSTTNGDMEDG